MNLFHEPTNVFLVSPWTYGTASNFTYPLGASLSLQSTPSKLTSKLSLITSITDDPVVVHLIYTDSNLVGVFSLCFPWSANLPYSSGANINMFCCAGTFKRTQLAGQAAKSVLEKKSP